MPHLEKKNTAERLSSTLAATHICTREVRKYVFRAFKYGGRQDQTCCKSPASAMPIPKQKQRKCAANEKKCAAERQNKYVKSNNDANTEAVQSQKHTNSENKCKRETLLFSDTRLSVRVSDVRSATRVQLKAEMFKILCFIGNRHPLMVTARGLQTPDLITQQLQPEAAFWIVCCIFVSVISQERLEGVSSNLAQMFT